MDEAQRKERNQSRLKECHSSFTKKIQTVLKEMENNGFRPRIQDAWRSEEEQLRLFKDGKTKVKFGFHNVTGPQMEPEALAVDILDDDVPLNPSHRYLLMLAAAAQAQDLETGIAWGLPTKALRDAVKAAIENRDFEAQVKIGWDPTHVQVTGITISEAKEGERPA